MDLNSTVEFSDTGVSLLLFLATIITASELQVEKRSKGFLTIQSF